MRSAIPRAMLCRDHHELSSLIWYPPERTSTRPAAVLCLRSESSFWPSEACVYVGSAATREDRIRAGPV